LASVVVGGVPSLLNHAHADVIADFSFEQGRTAGQPFSASTSITVTAGSLFGAFTAETGAGSAYGMHASTTGYSDPAGNGSPFSFSSNTWSAGDYYEFNVPTTGLDNIMFSYDQISSSTGPKAFLFRASADGVNFTAVGSYTLVLTQNATNSTGGTQTESVWSTNITGAYNRLFDLSGIPSLSNDPNAVFEIVENDTTTAPAGTDRIDNVVVTGTPVPEPAELSLLTVAAAGLMFRRRSADNAEQE
jgi:hypothetical protein